MVLRNTAVNVALGVLFSVMHISSSQAAVSYAPPTSVLAGAGPEFIAKGQLNGDSNIDLVSVNASGDTVSVMLGDGSGGFSKLNYPVGNEPRTVSIGDLDSDGDNDLVVTNTDTPGTGSVTILLNDGTGLFTEATGSPIDIETLAGAGAEPSAAVIAQLNSTTDAFADIAIGNDITDNVQILLGNNNGTFTAGATIAVGAKPIAITAGSVNTGTDTLTDIVVANLNGGTVNVLLGDGTGGFTDATGSPFAAGNKPFSVRIASVDTGLDTIPDIVLVNHADPERTVSVFKGVGDGTFNSISMFTSGALGGRPHSVDVADLDGDAWPDLLVASDATGTTPKAAFYALLGDGSGAFPSVTEYLLSGAAPNAIVSADLDGANQLDLAVANGNTSRVDVLLSVPTANPASADTGILAVTEDTVANGTLTGTDPDGALLKFALGSTAPTKGAVSLDAATGAYTYTPNANVNGGDSFDFTVDDGTGVSAPATITVTIAAVNDVPVRTAGTVSNLTVDEDSGLTTLGLGTLAYDPGATNESGQTLTYTVTAVPAASLGDVVLADGTTVVSAGNYPLLDIQGMQFRTKLDANGGPATFSFTVQDDGGVANGGVDTLTESLTIDVTAVNDPPTIGGTPLTSVNQDVAYSFTPTSNDVDGDTLTFSITNKPAWASFDTATGILSGTPTNADVGITSGIVISVTDNIIPTPVALPSFDLTVVNVNDAPTIGGTPATSVLQGAAYSFTPTWNDPDGDTLTFSITNMPTWASFDTATGALTGTPSNADVGITSGIVISVTDNIIATPVSLPSFNLTVVNVNDAPTISGTPATSVNQDAAYSFTPTAGDPDVGDTLTFSITNKPAWASFDTVTGALTGTPANADVGTTTGIVISVTDSASATTSLPSFDLTVVNVNDSPTISGTPATTVVQDAAYSFTPTAGDPDVGDTLTFSITNKPAWASFDTATGALTGTPTSADAGTTSGIVIAVTDGIIATPVSLPSFDLTVELDSNGDGISDAGATAIGLDPQLTDTDVDGASDAAEVGGDPANPLDTDSDGVIDALEFAAADPNTLEFVVPAPTATTLLLPDLSGKQVTLSGNGAAITANNNGTTGLPLYAESDIAVDDASFKYPFGVYDFNVVAPGGTATVTLTLPAGTVIPDKAVVRKLDASNQWQTLADTVAVIDRNNNTITLTLADNDGVFDLDNTAGIIRDPVGVAVPVPSGGGGGGGCSLSAAPGRTGVDPMLPLLTLLSLVYLRRRQRKANV